MSSNRAIKRQDASAKPYISRTRTGCVGCRLRRKKCDEQRPSCFGCQRSSLVCSWPEENPDRTAELLRRKTRTSVKPRIRKSTPLSFLKPESQQPPGTVDDHEDRQTIDILGSIQQSRCLQALHKQNSLHQPMSRIFFDHYIHKTNKILSVFQGATNPFIEKLLPIAMSHDVVLHSLLALSGVHYGYLERTPTCALVHYGKALREVKYGLTSIAQGEETTAVPLLVAALILCTAESCRGDSGALSIPHLEGARYLLETCLRLPGSRLDEDTRTFLIERYAYTATLANITLGVKSDDWISDDMYLFLTMKNEPGESAGTMSGRIHELFQLIPTVSKLARKREIEEYLQLETWDTRSSYLSLWAKILSWKSNVSDEVHTMCGQIYQQALLVYLISSFERFDKNLEHGDDSGSMYSPLVKATFDTFIQLLLSVPVESPISTTLCWPLVVFGSCAKLAEHRDVVRRRLAAMSTVLALVHALEARQLLEILWAKNDSSLAHPLSLEPIMKEEKMTILFL